MLTERFKDGWNYAVINGEDVSVDVSAPGVGILTTGFSSQNEYVTKDGTSFSAPLVSALVSLIIGMAQDNNNLSVQMVQDIITSTADKLDPWNCEGSTSYDGNGWNPCLGYGRINAYEALDLVQSPPSTPTGFTISGSIGQHPQLHWDLNEADIVSYKVYRKLTDQGPVYNLIATVDGNTNQFTDYEVSIAPGGRLVPKACYKIKAVDVLDQTSGFTPAKCKPYGIAKSILVLLPNRYELRDNYPNPFNPLTTLSYALPEASFVELKIYDLMGRSIRSLVSGKLDAGFKTAEWDSRDNYGNPVSSGVYITRFKARSLETGEVFHQTGKMILLR